MKAKQVDSFRDTKRNAGKDLITNRPGASLRNEVNGYRSMPSSQTMHVRAYKASKATDSAHTRTR